jgi:hypothetical protein
MINNKTLNPHEGQYFTIEALEDICLAITYTDYDLYYRRTNWSLGHNNWLNLQSSIYDTKEENGESEWGRYKGCTTDEYYNYCYTNPDNLPNQDPNGDYYLIWLKAGEKLQLKGETNISSLSNYTGEYVADVERSHKDYYINPTNNNLGFKTVNPASFNDDTYTYSAVTGILFKVYGNSLSLNCGDKFKEATLDLNDHHGSRMEATPIKAAKELGADYVNKISFKSAVGITDASGLVLPYVPEYMQQPVTDPSLDTSERCYYEMFKDCTSFSYPPKLKATKMSAECYSNMFSGCTALWEFTDKLSCKLLADYCYRYMFSGCSNMSNGPKVLPAMELTTGCYTQMFMNCTRLKKAPLLPYDHEEAFLIDSGIKNSYTSMFNGCSNLREISIALLPSNNRNTTAAIFNGPVGQMLYNAGTAATNPKMYCWDADDNTDASPTGTVGTWDMGTTLNKPPSNFIQTYFGDSPDYPIYISIKNNTYPDVPYGAIGGWGNE